MNVRTLVRLFERQHADGSCPFFENRVFEGWLHDCYSGCQCRGCLTNELDQIRFPKGISQRAAIVWVNIAALVLFVTVELGFSYFNFSTPHAMLLVAAVAILFRGGELALARNQQTFPSNSSRTCVVVSIAAGLIVPFALAAATRQFHTHYFGLLILPVLEAALYYFALYDAFRRSAGIMLRSFLGGLCCPLQAAVSTRRTA